jgi:hypothetical protein
MSLRLFSTKRLYRFLDKPLHDRDRSTRVIESVERELAAARRLVDAMKAALQLR